MIGFNNREHDRGRLAGIEVCDEERERSMAGELVSDEHLARCPVHRRRWRMLQAALSGWKPLDADAFWQAFDRVMRTFAEGSEDETDPLTRGFFAYVARDGEAEAIFAGAVAAMLATDIEVPEGPVVPRWTTVGVAQGAPISEEQSDKDNILEFTRTIDGLSASFNPHISPFMSHDLGSGRPEVADEEPVVRLAAGARTGPTTIEMLTAAAEQESAGAVKIADKEQMQQIGTMHVTADRDVIIDLDDQLIGRWFEVRATTAQGITSLIRNRVRKGFQAKLKWEDLKRLLEVRAEIEFRLSGP